MIWMPRVRSSCLSRSIPWRQASNASARWGEETIRIEQQALPCELLDPENVLVGDRDPLQHERRAPEEHRPAETIEDHHVFDDRKVCVQVSVHERNHVSVAPPDVHHAGPPRVPEGAFQREHGLVHIWLVVPLDPTGLVEADRFVESEQAPPAPRCRQRIALGDRKRVRRRPGCRPEVGPGFGVTKRLPSVRPIEQVREHRLVVATPMGFGDEPTPSIQVGDHADARLEGMNADGGEAGTCCGCEGARPPAEPQPRIEPEPRQDAEALLRKHRGAADVGVEPDFPAPLGRDRAEERPCRRARGIEPEHAQGPPRHAAVAPALEVP